MEGLGKDGKKMEGFGVKLPLSISLQGGIIWIKSESQPIISLELMMTNTKIA